jgi:hypothetical protein
MIPLETIHIAGRTSMPTSVTPPKAAFVPRTEKEIRERAAALLGRFPYRALQIVDCQYRDGALILNENVPSFHLKQMAQTAIAELFALARVDNRIIVQKAAAASED